MTDMVVAQLSDQQLVDEFASLSLQQFDQEYEEDGVAEYTRLYHAIDRIVCELRRRGVTALRALIPLLHHPNPRVRLNAVHPLLVILPEEARSVLEDLAGNAPGPQRLSAGMTLWHLSTGVYEPT